jgi:hypothetical protein
VRSKPTQPDRAARIAAARIAADEDRLAEYETGLLSVPSDVAAALDALIARRDADT